MMPPISRIGRIPSKLHEESPRDAGFSLILVIFLVAVVGLAVAVLPEGVFISSTYRGETELEMEMLGEAVHDYYADTGVFPSSLGALSIEPGGVTGWLGSYLLNSDDIAHLAANDFTRDAWGKLYTLTVTGNWTSSLKSSGADFVMGTADDVVILVDCNDVCRDETLAEIDILEGAILSWNIDCLPDNPLSSEWDNALGTLQYYEYLPDGPEVYADLLTDGWGQQYIEGPSPLFDLESLGPP